MNKFSSSVKWKRNSFSDDSFSFANAIRFQKWKTKKNFIFRLIGWREFQLWQCRKWRTICHNFHQDDFNILKAAAMTDCFFKVSSYANICKIWNANNRLYCNSMNASQQYIFDDKLHWKHMNWPFKEGIERLRHFKTSG